jgi:glycosyltransferase involved in cell wall biosynthesis
MKELISVIVPVDNRAHLALETLDSIFSKTYKNLKIMLVNDRSLK